MFITVRLFLPFFIVLPHGVGACRPEDVETHTYQWVGLEHSVVWRLVLFVPLLVLVW
jgi:hypothetical protein